MSFHVRGASSADAESILAIGSQVFTATYGHYVSSEDLQQYLGSTYSLLAFRQDLEDEQKLIIVAEDSHGKVVGYAYIARGTSEPCLSADIRKLELQRLYVLSSYQGSGVGKLLLDEVEGAIAKREGVTHVWLGVWEHNPRAINFYKRRGYVWVGQHMFPLGSALQRDMIMVKVLETSEATDV